MAAATATFDTLKFANTLKAAGVPDKQAEAQAVAFAEVMQLNLKDLVTKDDLTNGLKDLRQELKNQHDELKQLIKDVEQRANARIDVMSAQHRGDIVMMRWMLGVAATAVIGILVRLFIYRTPL